ncbi:methyl-accepting chemotaxis protein [Desulfitobacterium dichloroeliminans LMG P-21439]|uniref:Methyl-accepting chemotaxis protein n=1 Tax=Desulfitobacterium dichloroeliminans (strain LMG P-21439 / DCA1) TaxID=871963 RepID=L0FCA8_DESDL|nr:sugar diacid recognition domain-containing protein [Desulfitobacterium dichloroeliminans]AGA70640.1 methyl-accepting chemotaxis protein [Desulfitobacterium dichloroeliminans LMG P-21439]
MDLTAVIANEIVDFIYEQCGYHSIVCDKSARIIGDSAKTRLGVAHSGSQRILTSNQEVAVITAEDAEKSGGTMKEGYSLAIKVNREKIGSFGIAGPLAIVTPIAKVAAGMVIKTLREDEVKQTLRDQVHSLTAALGQAATAIEEMVASSQEVASISQSVSTKAQQGYEQVKATEEILEFIRRVSKQTNLLGLNAAIEASRAGEHGRGFQVVAGEVRKLAEDSNRSANDIQMLLQNFQDTIESVTEGVTESGKINLEQAKHTQDISEMVEGVKKVGQQLTQLADAL